MPAVFRLSSMFNGDEKSADGQKMMLKSCHSGFAPIYTVVVISYKTCLLYGTISYLYDHHCAMDFWSMIDTHSAENVCESEFNTLNSAENLSLSRSGNETNRAGVIIR